MVPVTVGANAVCVKVKACIEESTVEVINWREGDLLVVDNVRLLHARGRAEQDDEDRILARMLIRR
jgi:alpha-ketoglutarate-dependent taurine dioxygenase